MVRVALVSLFVQALFLDILMQKQLWLLLGIAFGLAASERIAHRDEREQPPASDPAVPVARRFT
jgi:hypothetical protein